MMETLTMARATAARPLKVAVDASDPVQHAVLAALEHFPITPVHSLSQ